MGEAGLADVCAEFVGEFAIARDPAATTRDVPRTRSSASVRVDVSARVCTHSASFHSYDSGDHRRGGRRDLGADAIGSALSRADAVVAVNRNL